MDVGFDRADDAGANANHRLNSIPVVTNNGKPFGSAFLHIGRFSAYSKQPCSAQEEDGCRWQLVDKDGSCVDGQFKRTDDPNILILKKENGEEFGTVHVAYISRRRNQGQIYLIRNTKVTRFYLVSTDPAFTVGSGDVDADV